MSGGALDLLSALQCVHCSIGPHARKLQGCIKAREAIIKYPAASSADCAHCLLALVAVAHALLLMMNGPPLLMVKQAAFLITSCWHVQQSCAQHEQGPS